MQNEKRRGDVQKTSELVEKKRNKRENEAPVIVEYEDHVLIKNFDPMLVGKVLRKAIGWIYFEDYEMIILFFDRPSQPMIPEKISPDVCLGIMKSSVLNVWTLDSQHLRSGEAH